MIVSIIGIVIFSLIFFFFCERYIYKRNITAEEARKVLLILIFILSITYAIYDTLI